MQNNYRNYRRLTSTIEVELELDDQDPDENKNPWQTLKGTKNIKTTKSNITRKSELCLSNKYKSNL